MALNILYIIFLILIGGIFGSIAKDRTPNYLIGISTAFIAVPFSSSFVKIDYNHIFLADFLKIQPYTVELWSDVSKFSGFIEHSLMLISIAGISSYIGAAILENIAQKVLPKDLDEIEKKVEDKLEKVEDDISHQLETSKKEKDELQKQIDILKVKELIRNHESESDSNKKSTYIEDALLLLEKYCLYENNKDVLFYKACLYKRISKWEESLKIIDTLIDSGFKNPSIMYNKGCYTYLYNHKKDENGEAKKYITQALTMECNSKKERNSQITMIEMVINKKDEDISDLFSDDELLQFKL